MGHGAWGMGIRETRETKGTRKITNAQCPMPNAHSPFIEKIFPAP
ncbi:hypothetical protein COO91_03018 [Nostoc flagelliforme CCNUN1]|uniref:Uncharacterized protein n=1 Tax=Nostoc flagelliforme CCNUN1 TaxID=2038116 RepID=A0A2K8SNP1_9NOSO|nr:hypothetical protein COO91_03018 [Nostoc flagelliforme CCNUN1]